ncbi:hypothetical protein D9619_013394 [Psilocybe cf. subviscida]|uniref:Uncharacterized protein n=1 Tax=Psilocybe cf. subviscida TaxID=2480587 RepID=A0A8H5BTR8_9AGAR|nr:hypothetical protein D9619_013394 [Psilocybe cf. subviscida]
MNRRQRADQPFFIANHYVCLQGRTEQGDSMANTAPQEIIDDILDHFIYIHLLPPSQIRHEEQASEYQRNLEVLRACSLVSKAFSHRAQTHLYSVIRLWPTSRDNGKDEKRRERLCAISDLCVAKPHIANNIRVLDIQLDGIDDYSSLFKRDDVAILKVLTHVCGNVTTLYIRGQHQTLSLSALFPTFNLVNITGLHIYHAKLAYSTMADLVNLSDLSFSSVALAEEDDSTARPAQIRLRKLFLQNVEDDVLDIIIHNNYGRAPVCYPVMNLSTLCSFKQGQSSKNDRRGYLYTLEDMLNKSRSSLKALEISKHPYFAGWMSKEQGLPVPKGLNSGSYNLCHMEQLRDVTIVSNLCHIDPVYGLHGELLSPKTGIETWLQFLAESRFLENLIVKFSFITRETDASNFFTACEPVIRWKYLCTLVGRVSNGRSMSFRLHVEWLYSTQGHFSNQDTSTAVDVLRENLSVPLRSLFDEFLSSPWITTSMLFTARKIVAL